MKNWDKFNDRPEKLIKKEHKIKCYYFSQKKVYLHKLLAIESEITKTPNLFLSDDMRIEMNMVRLKK
jgi:hypothetical protein